MRADGFGPLFCRISADGRGRVVVAGDASSNWGFFFKINWGFMFFYLYRLFYIPFDRCVMCDVYVRKLDPASFGGSHTCHCDNFLYVCRDIPQLALNAFNNAREGYANRYRGEISSV